MDNTTFGDSLERGGSLSPDGRRGGVVGSGRRARVEEAQADEGIRDPPHQRLPVPPYGGVEDGVVLVLRGARLLQGGHAVGSVVLQVRVLGVDGVGGAAAAEAREREVVVQREDAARVVEALDVLAGLGVVARAVHVLQHVHIVRDLPEPAVGVAHRVHEVDVPHVVGRAGVLLGLKGLGHHRLHQGLPRHRALGHDDLVSVQ